MHETNVQNLQQLKPKPAKLTSQSMCIYCKLFLAVRFLMKLWCKFHEDGVKRRNMYKLSNRRSRGSVLAFDTQVCGFKPGRIRRIFKGK